MTQKCLMKTLLFTLEYPPFHGGVAEYYGNLVKFWPAPDGIFVLDNNGRKLLSSWLWPRWLKALLALYRAIRKERIGHILVGHILPLGSAAYLVTRITKTPYTVFLHGMDFTYALKTKRKKKMTARILDNARNIVCASSFTAGLVGEFLGDRAGEKIKVVNPGIDTGITHNAKRVTSNSGQDVTRYTLRVISNDLLITEIQEKYRLAGKIILFSIGRLVKRKGFDKAIEAMAEVARLNPRVHYFLAGDGPDKKYIYERAAGVANVHFLGRLSEEDKWAWLKLCDIFIMPARRIGDDFEGFGIVYLEAALAGKPVIAGASGGVPDAVKGAVTGILVDPERTDRIAGAIMMLAQDARLRLTLGEQGRARATSEFDWVKQAEKVFNILNC